MANSLQKRFCTFFIRYRFTEATGYFILMDYDEMHTHPVNENFRNALISQNIWNIRKSKHTLDTWGMKKMTEMCKLKQQEQLNWIRECKAAEKNRAVSKESAEPEDDIDIPIPLIELD